MKILTRAEAEILKVKKYFSGHFCERGHLTLRYTNSGACVECVAYYGRVRRSALKTRRKSAKQTQLAVVVHVHPADVEALKKYARKLQRAHYNKK